MPFFEQALSIYEKKLLISPDGVLNLLPFGALVDEQGRYLIEQYSLTCLTTGRDLLRMQTGSRTAQGIMVIADPDFGEPAGAVSERGLKIKKGEVVVARQSDKEAVDFSQVYFGPLPGCPLDTAGPVSKRRYSISA